MNFICKGRKYEIIPTGAIFQTDHRPFVYDPNYSAIYDTEAYRRKSDILQALRFGFIQAAHGRPVNSILDVGYGNGAFMEFAKMKVPYVYGTDVTGVTVPDGCTFLPEIVKADVICFHDVLEHIPDLSFLKLLPCETLVVSLPYCHYHTHGFTWFECNYKHRKPDEHVWHFNEYSLKTTLALYGWFDCATGGHEDIVRESAHGLQNILTMAFKRQRLAILP